MVPGTGGEIWFGPGPQTADTGTGQIDIVQVARRATGGAPGASDEEELNMAREPDLILAWLCTQAQGLW